MDALLQYDYPGNVRELRNILERMVALNDGTILHGNFPYASSHPAKSAVSGSIPENITDSSSGFACLRDARAQFEKDYIEGVLKHTGGNVTEAAEILQITKRQLWNKISEYEIHRTSL